MVNVMYAVSTGLSTSMVWKSVYEWRQRQRRSAHLGAGTVKRGWGEKPIILKISF